jgi:hypothetical protein
MRPACEVEPPRNGPDLPPRDRPGRPPAVPRLPPRPFGAIGWLMLGRGVTSVRYTSGTQSTAEGGHDSFC